MPLVREVLFGEGSAPSLEMDSGLYYSGSPEKISMILGCRVYIIATHLRVNKCETDVTIVGAKPYSKGVRCKLVIGLSSMNYAKYPCGQMEPQKVFISLHD